ncbi:hypothetical protein CARUB_v10010268mg, partial [Capsella rubella]
EALPSSSSSNTVTGVEQDQPSENHISDGGNLDLETFRSSSDAILMLPTERKALPSSCSSIIGSNRLVEQQGQVEQQQARVEHNFLTCFDSDNISLRCFDSVESSGQRMNQIKRDLGLRDCDDGSKDIDFSVYMTIPPRLLKQRVLMPGTQEQEVVVPGTQEQEAVTQEQEAVTQEQEVLPVKVYLPKKKKKQPKKGREPFQKLDWSLVTVPDNNTTPS